MSGPGQGVIIRKGCLLMNQGRYSEAAAMFKDGLSADPEDASLLYYLALAQYHQASLRSQSLHTINEALKYLNDEPAFYELKALIQTDLGKPKEALESIEQALLLDAQSVQAHAVKAYVFCDQEKWAEAEAAARQALSIDADHQFAGSLLATSLRMQNKLEEGAHLVSGLLAKDPEDCLSHTNAGWVYLQKKDYARAQVHFREALRLDPNFEPARAGMLETFKSRSPVYRLYLEYCLFMARQPRWFRTAFIIGVFLVFRFIGRNFKTIFHGPWVVAGGALIAFFFVFFFWTWLAGGVGNLLVLLDPVARYALKKKEQLDAIFVGGSFLVGVVLVLLGLLFRVAPLILFSLGLVLSAVPFSVTFVNKNKHGRLLYGAIGGYILLSTLAAAVGSAVSGKEDIPGVLSGMFTVGLVAFVLTTWLGAFGVLRK